MTDDSAPLATLTLAPDDALLRRMSPLFGDSPGGRALSLAQALVTSPPWSRVAGCAGLAVRQQPAPVIALAGRFDADDQARLDALGWQVHDALSRLRPVGYDEVGRACDVLGEQLLHHLGEQRLRAARVVGLPRGGLVVAGLLAYSLGLSHDQLSDPPGSREMIVVDDCMLSGARTRRWLAHHEGPPVVLAHLHSHPDLRSAVEQDPRVAVCIAAADLHDHAPERHGAQYPAWRARWAERSPDDFWTGHPDHVCYPWNEPDTVFWNDRAGLAEAGWHVVPPSWCLKNRGRRPAQDVQLCESRHVPDDVVWVFVDEVLVLARPGEGATLELGGTGVDFWRELLRTGQPDAAAQVLSVKYDVAPELLREDLNRFAGALRQGGWWRAAL